MSLRNLGVPAPVSRDGPFRAMREGNVMLAPFQKTLARVPAGTILRPGLHILHRGDHFAALVTHGGGAVFLDGLSHRVLTHDDLSRLSVDAAVGVFELRSVSDTRMLR
jgi:hypothetical protein